MSVIGKKPFITTAIEDLAVGGNISDLSTCLNAVSSIITPVSLDPANEDFFGTDVWFENYSYTPMWARVELDRTTSPVEGILIPYSLYGETELSVTHRMVLLVPGSSGEDINMYEITYDLNEDIDRAYNVNYRIVPESLDINELRREVSGANGQANDIYVHNIKFSTEAPRCVVNFISKSSSPYNYDTFVSTLKAKGFTSINKSINAVAIDMSGATFVEKMYVGTDDEIYVEGDNQVSYAKADFVSDNVYKVE